MKQRLLLELQGEFSFRQPARPPVLEVKKQREFNFHRGPAPCKSNR